MERRQSPVTPGVVRRQVVLEELDVAPDGERAVVVRRTVAGIEYRRALWLVPLRRGRPRQLTAGLPNDTHPRFSPDGTRLAFLSARPDELAWDGAARRGAIGESEPAAGPTTERGASDEQGAGPAPTTQVWLLPLDGGEPRALTSAPHGVRGFAWSPDGKRIAFWAPAGPARFAVDAPRRGATPTAHRISAGGWRFDEEGLVERRTHLFVTAARPGAAARQLTSGDFDVIGPAWDPDGSSLVFCAARHVGADLFPRPSVHRIAASGSASEPAELIRLRGLVESVTPSPDGRWLALVGADVEDAPDDVGPSLYVAPSDGCGPAVSLAPELDLPIGVWVDTDLHGWSSAWRPGPIWAADDDALSLVALTSRRGRSEPWRYPFDPSRGAPAGEPHPLVEAEIACMAVAAGGGSLAALATLDDRAPEVLLLAGGTARRVTSLGSAWQRTLRRTEMRNLHVDGPGGSIETWLASPPDAGAARLPLVVNIHGGPLGAWAPAPSLETQMLVSAGFRVALPNIRGSAGYGGDWIRAHMGHWGEVDAEDVLAVVDRLVADGLADPARLGLLGLSYGGFLVSWLVGTAPDRFAAAVSEAGITNQLAAWALSDTGPDYNRRSRLGDPLTPEGAADLWRRSPLRHVAAIRTPLLLLQGEADLRCPAADNEQLFVALRALGRTVEYVTYPESYHVYAVAGRPDRRIDRHTRMLAWFRRYLG